MSALSDTDEAELHAALLASWMLLAPASEVNARGPVQANADAWSAVGADLVARYAEPSRRYHGLTHLAAVLDAVAVLERESAEPEAVRLAAWFHDAVYDPTGADNEEASAVLAERLLREVRVPAATIAEVARLVRLTRSHKPEPDDRNGAVLCDADLSILASDDDRYAKYTATVREEYRHVSDADFRVGRARVLATLLDHSQLFSTALGRQWWERKARANLRREIGELRATPPR